MADLLQPGAAGRVRGVGRGRADRLEGRRRTVATGNSFAAPHIAGLVALILSKHPGLSPFEVKAILASVADNPGRRHPRPRAGTAHVSLARTYVELFRRNRALGAAPGRRVHLRHRRLALPRRRPGDRLRGEQLAGAARDRGCRPHPAVRPALGAGRDRRRPIRPTDGPARDRCRARRSSCSPWPGAVIVDAPTIVIVGLSILAACFSTFFGPAIAALLPMLVDESDLGPGQQRVGHARQPRLHRRARARRASCSQPAASRSPSCSTRSRSRSSPWSSGAFRFREPPAPVDDVATTSPRPSRAGWRELVRPLAGPFVLDSVDQLRGRRHWRADRRHRGRRAGRR